MNLCRAPVDTPPQFCIEMWRMSRVVAAPLRIHGSLCFSIFMFGDAMSALTMNEIERVSGGISFAPVSGWAMAVSGTIGGPLFLRVAALDKFSAE